MMQPTQSIRSTRSVWALAPAAAIAALVASQSALAVVKTWVGGTGIKSWHDAANWQPVGVPASTDDVFIQVAGGLEVRLDGNGNCHSLTLSEWLRVPFSRTLTIHAGGVDFDGGTIILGDDISGGGKMVLSGTQVMSGSGEILMIVGGDSPGLEAQGGEGTIGAGVTVRASPGKLKGTQTGFLGATTGAKLINEGTIFNDLFGVTLQVGPTTGAFINHGLIDVGSGGIFKISSALPPMVVGDVHLGSDGRLIIATANTQSVAGISNEGGTVEITTSFDNAGMTLVPRGRWIFGGNSTLTGGRLDVPRDGDVKVLGTLKSLTLSGLITTDPGEEVLVQDGLTLDKGVILLPANTLTPGGAILTFATSSQTLGGNGSILLGSGGLAADAFIRSTIANGTLTVGPGVVIEPAPGSLSGGTLEATVANTTIDMQGTVRATAAGQEMRVSGVGLVVNKGSLEAWADSTLRVSAGYLLAPGGHLTAKKDGIVLLTGTFTVAALGPIGNEEGTVNVQGTINGPGTLATHGEWVVRGTFSGFTLEPDPKSTLTTSAFGSTPTFNSMVLRGTIYVADSLRVGGGMMLDDAQVVIGDTSTATLQFNGGVQNVGGVGEFILRPGSSTATAQLQTIGTGTAVTLGSGITVRPSVEGLPGTHQVVVATGHSVTNAGTILSDVPGKTMRVNSTGTFVNSNVLRASNGASLALLGAHSTPALGSMDVSGGSLVIQCLLANTGQSLTLPGAPRLQGPGQVTGGTLVMPGATELVMTGTTGSPAVLDGTTIEGHARLPSGAVARVTNGLTLSAGEIVVESGAASARIDFNGGAQTLGGTGEIVLTTAGTTAQVNLLGAGANLTIAAGVTLSSQGGSGSAAHVLTTSAATQTITNLGTIRSDASGRPLSISGPGAFSNLGTLRATGGAALDVMTSTLSNLAGNTLTGGVWIADADSTLSLGTAAVQSLGGGTTIALNGLGSTLPAANGLEALAAGSTFSLTDGRSWSAAPASGSFTNAGSLVLGVSSSFAVTGAYAQPATGSLTKTFAGAEDASDDSVTATGSASIAGAIVVAFAPGLVVTPPISWPLVSASALAGTFGSVVTPLDGDALYAPPFVAYSPTNASFVVGYVPGVFMGEKGSNWFDAGNWSDGVLPDPRSEVAIVADAIIGSRGGAAYRVVVHEGGSLTLADEGSLLVDELVIHAGGSLVLDGVASIVTVHSLTIDEGAQLAWRGGTLVVDGGALDSGLALEIGCVDDALLRLVSGAAVAAPSIWICGAGELTGEGSISSTTVNHGRIAPGSPIGTLVIDGDLVSGTTGVLAFDWSDRGADRLEVTGIGALDGTLAVALVEGAEPAPSSEPATLLEVGTSVGSFRLLVSPASGGVFAWPLFDLRTVAAKVSALPSVGGRPVEIVARVIGGESLCSGASSLAIGRATGTNAGRLSLLPLPPGVVEDLGPEFSGTPRPAFDAQNEWTEHEGAILVAHPTSGDPASGGLSVLLDDGSTVGLIESSALLTGVSDVVIAPPARLLAAASTGVVSMAPGVEPTPLIALDDVHRIAVAPSGDIWVSLASGAIGVWTGDGDPIDPGVIDGLDGAPALATPAAPAWGGFTYFTDGDALARTALGRMAEPIGTGFEGTLELEAVPDGSLVALLGERCAIVRIATPRAPGDLDGDGEVNGADLTILLGAWGTNLEDADLNDDGTVDGGDIAILLGAWTG